MSRIPLVALLSLASFVSIASPASAQDVAPISFRSATPDVTLHVRTGTTAVPVMMGDGRGGATTGIVYRGVYRRLCTAPCEIMVARGQHQLALSLGVGGEQDVGQLVSITGPSTLYAEYTSHREARIAGWLTFAVGVASGLALILAGVIQPVLELTARGFELRDPHIAMLVTGGVALALGVSIGLTFGLQRDAVSISVGPQD